MTAATPLPSALSSFILSHSETALRSIQRGPSESISSGSVDESTSIHPTSPYTALALQVQHSLQYQHLWTSLALHTHSPLDPTQTLARPLLSGLPPTRLYVHPDDQAEELKAEAERKRAVRRHDGTTAAAVSTAGDASSPSVGPVPGPQPVASDEPSIEREWVLPTHLREKWSLARFAEVFDAIDEEPPGPGSGVDAEDGGAEHAQSASTQSASTRRRRGGKRVLMAIASDDSAISYYIVHDGIVKPRQN